MNALEAAKLCRVVAGVNPAQKFDEDTPSFWHAVLVDVNLADALEAVKRLAQREKWIGTSDICKEVGTLRRARIAALEEAGGLVPNVDPDDPRAFAAEQRALNAAAADGTLDVEAYDAGGFTLTGAAPRRPLAIEGTRTMSPEMLRSAIRANALGAPEQRGAAL